MIRPSQRTRWELRDAVGVPIALGVLVLLLLLVSELWAAVF